MKRVKKGEGDGGCEKKRKEKKRKEKKRKRKKRTRSKFERKERKHVPRVKSVWARNVF